MGVCWLLKLWLLFHHLVTFCSCCWYVFQGFLVVDLVHDETVNINFEFLACEDCVNHVRELAAVVLAKLHNEDPALKHHLLSPLTLFRI